MCKLSIVGTGNHKGYKAQTHILFLTSSYIRRLVHLIYKLEGKICLFWTFINHLSRKVLDVSVQSSRVPRLFNILCVAKYLQSVWTDKICINKTGSQESGKQVSQKRTLIICLFICNSPGKTNYGHNFKWSPTEKKKNSDSG